MTSYTGYSTGEIGYTQIATESDPAGSGTPGTFVAPTQPLMAESVSLDSAPAHIQRNIYGGDRDADRGHRTGKSKVGGQVQYALYPTNGFELMVAALGKDTYLSAIASVDSTAFVTAGGISTATMASTTGYQVGAFHYIDTGANKEVRQLISKTGTTLIYAACSLAHGATTAITQPAQHQVTPYTTTDGFGNKLRTVSVEENLGGKYSWQYAGGLVDQWSLKAAASKFDVTCDLKFNKERVKAGSPTAWDGSDTSLDDIGLEFTDGFIAMPADPTDSGTATLQLMGDGEDWSMDLKNNLVEKATFDGTSVYRYFPGMRTVDVKFQMLNEASRPVAWTDFLTQNLNVPWFAQAVSNFGNNLQAWGVRLPNVRVTKSTEVRGLSDVIGENIEATAIKAGGLEKIEIYVINGFTTAV